MIKGWAITLVVVTLLLKGDVSKFYLALIPLVVFWGLDAYFLQLERRYRKLYQWVIKNREKTEEYLFDMNAHRFKDEVSCWFKIMFSKTLFLFYGSIAILIFIYKFTLASNACS